MTLLILTAALVGSGILWLWLAPVPPGFRSWGEYGDFGRLIRQTTWTDEEWWLITDIRARMRVVMEGKA